MPDRIHPVPAAAAAATRTTAADYHARYVRSIADPDGFWRDQAPRLDWLPAPTIMGDRSLDAVAIIWEADTPGAATRRLTYDELLGVTSTLADPSVVDALIAGRLNV